MNTVKDFTTFYYSTGFVVKHTVSEEEWIFACGL